MRRTSIVLMGFAVLFLSSCSGDKPKNSIVGKWDSIDEAKLAATYEFSKDGGCKMIMKIPGSGDAKATEATYEGKYKFVDDETMDLELNFAGRPFTKEQDKVKVSNDELTLTDKDGGVQKFKRVK